MRGEFTGEVPSGWDLIHLPTVTHVLEWELGILDWLRGIGEIQIPGISGTVEVVREAAVEVILEEGVAHALTHLLPCHELKRVLQCQQCCDDTWGSLGNDPTIRHCYIECSALAD